MQLANFERVLLELLLQTRSRFLVNLLLHEVFEDAADTEVGTEAEAVINEVVASVVMVPGGEKENDCGKAV